MQKGQDVAMWRDRSNRRTAPTRSAHVQACGDVGSANPMREEVCVSDVQTSVLHEIEALLKVKLQRPAGLAFAL